MAFVHHQLGALVRARPAEARAEIVEVLRKNFGIVCRAARQLGVDERTLRKWLELLGLAEAARAMRAKNGIGGGRSAAKVVEEGAPASLPKAASRDAASRKR